MQVDRGKHSLQALRFFYVRGLYWCVSSSFQIEINGCTGFVPGTMHILGTFIFHKNRHINAEEEQENEMVSLLF